MFAEDMTAFFDVSELADTITLDGVQMAAYFDNGYSTGTVGSAGMASGQPSVMLPTAQVPAYPVGKAVQVYGVNYRVGLNEPDGTGLTTLFLERTA